MRCLSLVQFEDPLVWSRSHISGKRVLLSRIIRRESTKSSVSISVDIFGNDARIPSAAASDWQSLTVSQVGVDMKMEAQDHR